MFCFVTVGSTKFEELVNTVLSENTLKSLKSMGYYKLCIQCGSGRIPLNFDKIVDEIGNQCWQSERFGVSIIIYEYLDNIIEKMNQADLIIGHGGAGTCIEVLDLYKPFIVVVNEELADNHQMELASKLASEGYLLYTIPSELLKTLVNPDLFNLKRFERANPEVFHKFLNDL